MASEADKYEVLERIGQGSFGVIRRVRRKGDGLVLCRKEICYTKMTQKERDQLQAELDILRRLKHPNIVRYYEREHHKASHDLHLYMEYCGNGDLGMMIKDLKQKHAFADEEQVWTIFAQLVSALYLCHYGEDAPDASGNAVGLAKNAHPIRSKQSNQMILHRDLKPENVFLGDGNAVKLGDFGLSKMILSHDFASTYVGTPFYMSPEICAAEKYSLYSDIWSLGCIIYELCAREPPFNAKTHLDLIQKIRLGKVAPLPRTYSRELQDVITACLQVNPNARPDTAALLNLPRVKLVRKSQQNALMLQQHMIAKDQAIEELRLAKEYIQRLEAEKQAMHDQIHQKLRLEWETRARLEINEQVGIEIKKLEAIFEQKVEEEVERRNASRPTSYTSSFASNAHSLDDFARICEEIPRSSTPTGSFEDHLPVASLGTVGEAEEDEDLASTTDFTSLSLQESPLVQKQKPIKKSTRTPFTRARTIASAEGLLPSPMDVQMADPSPIRSLASLSLSPRRTAPLEGSNLRQPALRSNNIFDKAAMRETGATLFPKHSEDDDDDDDDNDDSGSPTRAKVGADPFKAPARPTSGIGRPMLARQKTMPVQMHARLRSTPNLYGPTAAAHRVTPASTTSAENSRPTSPNRRPLSRGLSVSPARKAPPPPSQPSPTAISARKGKDDLVKAMHQKKLQGRTLVELNMAEINAPRSSGAEKGAEIAAKMCEPLWDPERDEMPSPFLVRTRKAALSR